MPFELRQSVLNYFTAIPPYSSRRESGGELTAHPISAPVTFDLRNRTSGFMCIPSIPHLFSLCNVFQQVFTVSRFLSPTCLSRGTHKLHIELKLRFQTYSPCV
ncbi:hypothetical protein CEXT_279411 [Caerostris extrusa]|uniref:Uncharacterized protein n=1 Tax=Caerostris extrusa TaxID=172846 RepID=A0AAV4XFZ8_CAEEX|nr:hypothetical protein CEXT_279411 [Caerostris extrusa]